MFYRCHDCIPWAWQVSNSWPSYCHCSGIWVCTCHVTLLSDHIHSFLLCVRVSISRYSNIFVTSPTPENLRTLFEFVFKGLDSVEYREHEHYEIIQSTNPDFNHAVVRVNIFQQHRQTIQVYHCRGVEHRQVYM